MNEFIITFRESLEAALIVGIIFTIVDKNGFHSQKRMLWMSVIASVISSAILGVALHKALESVGNDAFKEFLEGIFMYITAALLFYVIFWMSKNLASKNAIQEQTGNALEGGKKWGLFFLVFFAILREGFETAFFLVGSTVEDKSFSYSGFFAGLLLAILIGYLIVVRGKKIKLAPFFKYTSLLLVFFAAGMIASATHETHEYMEKREQAEQGIVADNSNVSSECAEYLEHVAGNAEAEEYAFNIFPIRTEDNKPDGGWYEYKKDCGVYVPLLNSNGTVGSFLHGLLGYNSSPTWLELILWFASIVFGLIIWRRAYGKKK